MQRFDIDEHLIIKLFEKDFIEIGKLRVKTKKGDTTLLEPKSMYVFKNLWQINEIKYKLRDLGYSIMFINSFPSIDAWRKNISRAEYFIYHYEYYLNSSVGILDRLLLYANHVYDLGLHPRHVKLDIILENSRVSDEIKKQLKGFDSYLQKTGLKEKRNFSSHQKKLSRKSWKKLDGLSIFQI